MLTITTVYPNGKTRVRDDYTAGDATLNRCYAGGSFPWCLTFPQSSWTDTHIPRTEKPVRFYPKGRPAPYPGPTDVCVELAYGSTFRMSEPVRVY